jgi:peptidoglycan/xylan/chitin deacetylase (PgdA/CDA1 family)
LTFDDGWQDNYSQAWPLLRARNIPAAIFLSTEYIATNKIFWVEQLRAARPQDPNLDGLMEFYKHMPASQRDRELKRLFTDSPLVPAQDAMLTWHSVGEMSRDGIEFGAHTHTHPLLTYEDSVTVQRELELPLALMQEQVGANAHLQLNRVGIVWETIHSSFLGYYCTKVT